MSLSSRPPAPNAALPDDARFVRHITRAAGVDVHWAEAGRGRPLVLLHGVCDSHRTWRKVAAPLSLRRRVLMPDLPGHGLSDRPDAPYTLEWYADVMGAWIDALGLRSFDLVGHSFGGGLAQLLLLTHGARVRRLALVAPGGLGKEVSLGLRLMSIADVVERIAQPLMSQSTRIGVGALLPGGDAVDVEQLSWMNGMPGTARALSRTVRGAVGWRGQKRQFYDRAHEVALLPPIALFWGDKDSIVPIEHATGMMGRLEEVSLTRFDACGHFPHQEHPEAFASALGQFLDAPSLPARLRGALALAPKASWWARAWRGVAMWIARQASALASRIRTRPRPRLPSAP